MNRTRNHSAGERRPRLAARYVHLAWVAASVLAAVGPPRPAAGQAAPPAAGPAASFDLETLWPGHPEWVAMLTDILRGSQLGPGEGWFRKAVGRTRFDWFSARSGLDKDGDGAVDRREFGGTDADFARLDRDRDGLLTGPDFDFSPHALTPSPGSMLFQAADRDGNGKVTREEFEAVFRALDAEGLGYLSLSDLQRAFGPPRPRPTGPPAQAGSGGPTRSVLLKGLFRQEIGSLRPGPSLEEAAPDFTLRTADGKDEVTLSKLVGPKPVVLVFGNFTCGPFRGQAGNVEKLYQRYKDRATFVMVYVREAHPTDGWTMESNERTGVALRQPRTYGERVEVAQACGKALGLGFPMLVDTLDDAVGARYSGMPSRLYLIDGRGKVAYKSGRGPFGFKPAELEHSLILLIRQEATTAAADPATRRPAADATER